MLNAIIGRKFMLIVIYELKLYAHCLQGVKLYAHCYTGS